MRALRLEAWKSDPVLADVPDPAPGGGRSSSGWAARGHVTRTFISCASSKAGYFRGSRRSP